MGFCQRFNLAVNFPLMPKGVEHFDNAENIFTDQSVNFPLMPKGVEHAKGLRLTEQQFTGEFSIDAERR